MSKTLDEAGVKRLIQEIKGANKNLNTPISISTDNTTESKAQNAKNIADYVEKAKAAGIASVNGMAVTCIIDNDYSGVGYLYSYNGGPIWVTGIITYDDTASSPTAFFVDNEGLYSKREVVIKDLSDQVTSDMLVEGARKPIIFATSTTEVDEETYQKLLSDSVDVWFKPVDDSVYNLCSLTYKNSNDTSWDFYFTCFSVEGETDSDIYLCGYVVTITKNSPHTCSVSENLNIDFPSFLTEAGYLHKSTLSPVLQEISLTGTDADRKAKLDKFEKDWKALTGASDLTGARFVGHFEYNNKSVSCLFIYGMNMTYGGVFSFNDGDDNFHTYMAAIEKDVVGANIIVTKAVDYSHLEAITIKTSNSDEDKAANAAAIQAYVDNLTALGVDTTKGYTIPVYINKIGSGFLCKTGNNIIYYMGVMNMYGSSSFGISVDAAGGYFSYKLQTETDNFLATTSKQIVGAINEVNTPAKGVKAFGAIELKASDNAANKTALAAYLKILTDAQVDTTNGYSIPVRITGNSQEYHGMLNIGTGVLLSGIVTDINENHHYPFNISTTDGVITFDESNYFLEKTSDEVTEMLDAIKYSHTSVPFTDTTLSNKAQLEVFLSKVPDATVMHCTYNEIWAGTLHKINGDWYGLLVKNTNSPADNINVKLSADGTIIKSNSAQ